MTQANTNGGLATANDDAAYVMEQVLMAGDLGKLSGQDRVLYYNTVCQSVGLNPLTRPFDYIQLNGKLTLYAKKDCTDQLRNIHEVSVSFPSREVVEGVFVVTARAKKPNGRIDESIGAVTIDGLKGDARANAMMKAETKAKRRVTLSICGLGLLDETELETIPASSRSVSHDDDSQFRTAWDLASKSHGIGVAQGREVLESTLSDMHLDFGSANESTRTTLLERYRNAKQESVQKWKLIGQSPSESPKQFVDTPELADKDAFEKAATTAGDQHGIDGSLILAGIDRFYNGREFDKIGKAELRVALNAISDNRFDCDSGKIKPKGKAA